MIVSITNTIEYLSDNDSNYIFNYQGVPSDQIKTIKKYSDEKVNFYLRN
jgi:hypothetical protein